MIVVSLLSGEGTTGVEVHFKSILRTAKEQGLSTGLITPYSKNRWIQRLANFVVNRWKNWHTESAHLWLRRVHRHRLVKHLTQALSKAQCDQVTLYAQDPLSAEVAIQLRDTFKYRVVTTVHFNKSEAEEFATKGITQSGGKLWNVLLAVEERVLPKVDQLIFVSDFMRQQVSSRIPLVSHTPINVIANFTRVSVDRSRKRTRDAISIGSLEPRKNQKFLIQVIAACKRAGANYTLDIVGTGYDESMLKELVKKLDLTEQIHFKGAIPNAAERVGNYKVFLHGATMESFGIVLIEALASATPVIAHPVGGIPEVFTDGLEGMYWKTDSIEESAKQLMQLLDSPQRYASMSDAAARRFDTQFDPETLSQRWLNTITNHSVISK